MIEAGARPTAVEARRDHRADLDRARGAEDRGDRPRAAGRAERHRRRALAAARGARVRRQPLGRSPRQATGNVARCDLRLDPQRLGAASGLVERDRRPRTLRRRATRTPRRSRSASCAPRMRRSSSAASTAATATRYIDPLLYDPQGIARALEREEMVSVVAAAPDGTIAGHSAVLTDEPGDRVPEAGKLVVDPRYRGHGLAVKLADAAARGRRRARLLRHLERGGDEPHRQPARGDQARRLGDRAADRRRRADRDGGVRAAEARGSGARCSPTTRRCARITRTCTCPSATPRSSPSWPSGSGSIGRSRPGEAAAERHRDGADQRRAHVLRPRRRSASTAVGADLRDQVARHARLLRRLRPRRGPPRPPARRPRRRRGRRGPRAARLLLRSLDAGVLRRPRRHADAADRRPPGRHRDDRVRAARGRGRSATTCSPTGTGSGAARLSRNHEVSLSAQFARHPRRFSRIASMRARLEATTEGTEAELASR